MPSHWGQNNRNSDSSKVTSKWSVTAYFSLTRASQSLSGAAFEKSTPAYAPNEQGMPPKATSGRSANRCYHRLRCAADVAVASVPITTDAVAEAVGNGAGNERRDFAVVVVGVSTLNIRGELLRGPSRIDQNRAARGGPAVERPLRSFQDFYALDVDQVRTNGGRIGLVEAIHIGCDVVLLTWSDDLSGDSANGRLDVRCRNARYSCSAPAATADRDAQYYSAQADPR